jgi:hypothetical protein
MSHYIYNLGASIERALAQVPTAQPAQIVGYWAVRDFWIEEFNHLLQVIDGYEARLDRMESAYEAYLEKGGKEHYVDHFGNLKQTIRDTTSAPQRRQVAGEARSALKALAERSLTLGIASPTEYQTFVDRLRIDNH